MAGALRLTMIVPGTVAALATYALPEARLKLIFACVLLIIMGLLLLRGAA